jgi:hypothetical protein
MVRSWEGDGGGKELEVRGTRSCASDGAAPTALRVEFRCSTARAHTSVAVLHGAVLHRNPPLQRRSPAMVWRAGAAFGVSSSAGSSAHPLRRALLGIQHPAGGGGLPR